MLLVLQAGGLTSAQTLMRTIDWNGNGIADGWSYDDNDDGVIDRLLIDRNEQGLAEVVIYASGGRATSIWADLNLDDIMDGVIEFKVGANGTGYSTWFWLDADENGRWENAYYDGESDGYCESVLVDTDFDGSADTWRDNVAPLGQTATDAVIQGDVLRGAIDSVRWLGNLWPPSAPIF
jgi:hypothetical protein